MQKALKALGLSTYECRALEALLREKHTLKELSKAAKIPLGKVYSVAKQLSEKGLITTTDARPKELYVENASGTVSKLIKEYEQKQDKIVDTLQELATSLDKEARRETPFFDIGATIEDNARIQMRAFTEAEHEVLQILNIHHKPKSNRKSKSAWEREIENCIKKGVIFKSIYPVDAELPKTLKKLSQKHPDRFQIKRLNTDFVRCDIIDGKKVLLKLVHEDPLSFGGVLFIENQQFAKNLKNVFCRFWEEAE